MPLCLLLLGQNLIISLKQINFTYYIIIVSSMKISVVSSKKLVVPRSRKFLSLHTSYYMRLEVYRRHKRPIFKIVVTNHRNRVVACLGYYNPFGVSFKSTYTNLVFSSLKGKTLGIDTLAAAHWLTKDIIVSPFLVVLLEALGLLKVSLGGADSFRFFHDARVDAYQSVDSLEEKLN
jgi:ribosomal protein S16